MGMPPVSPWVDTGHRASRVKRSGSLIVPRGTRLEAGDAPPDELGDRKSTSRLPRSQADLPRIIERLAFRGVCVLGAQDGFDSSREDSDLSAGLHGIIGQQSPHNQFEWGTISSRPIQSTEAEQGTALKPLPERSRSAGA